MKFFNPHSRLTSIFSAPIYPDLMQHYIKWGKQKTDALQAKIKSIQSTLQAEAPLGLNGQIQDIIVELDKLSFELNALTEVYSATTSLAVLSQSGKTTLNSHVALENRLLAVKEIVAAAQEPVPYWSIAMDVLANRDLILEKVIAVGAILLNPLRKQRIREQLDTMDSQFRALVNDVYFSASSTFNTVMKRLNTEDRDLFFEQLWNAGNILPLIHHPRDLTNVLASLSDPQKKRVILGAKDLLYDNHRRKEMSHVLGLANPTEAPKSFGEHEGFYMQSANLSSKTRFQTILNRKDVSLTLDLEKPFQQLANFGSYQGMHARWEGDFNKEVGLASSAHAIAFFQIHEGENTHLIYVNKGQRHMDDMITVPPVMAFSFPTVKIQPVLSDLEKVLQTQDRIKIGDFVDKKLKPYHNLNLSDKIKKGDQKVANCTISNSNIAWHIHLASEHMTQHHVGFIEAYQATLPQYKAMRKQDRGQAFSFLFSVARHYLYENNELFHEDVFQSLFKLYKKELQVKKGPNIRPTLTEFIKVDPENAQPLFNTLWEESFLRIAKTRIQSMNPMRFKQDETLPKNVDVLLICFQLEWAIQLHQLMIDNHLNREDEGPRRDKINEMKDQLLSLLPEKADLVRSFAPSLKNDAQFRDFLENTPSYFEKLIKNNPHDLPLVKLAYSFDPNAIRFAYPFVGNEVVIEDIDACQYIQSKQLLNLIYAKPDVYCDQLEVVEKHHPGLLAQLSDWMLLNLVKIGKRDLSFVPILANRVSQYCLENPEYNHQQKADFIKKIMGPLAQSERQHSMKAELEAIREKASSSDSPTKPVQF